MERKQITSPNTLLNTYDEDLLRLKKRVGKDRAMNTLKALQQGRNYVASFLKSEMKCDDILIQDLLPSFINDFSAWLSADRKLRGGTVWLTCQQLKGVVTRAHQRGLIPVNPFAGFHIPKNIRPREYLTEEELNRLIKHPFKKKSLAFARDIFIFSALTGLSFVDIQKMSNSDIMNIGGAMWIAAKRHKTKIPYQVKLLEIPLQIVSHYQQEGHQTIFGFIEYRSLASNIREVMKELGIEKHITMHCARHSFAVLAINKGMPIESLSRILGHTNISTTQIYAKITMQKLDSDMQEFEKQLNMETVCYNEIKENNNS